MSTHLYVLAPKGATLAHTPSFTPGHGASRVAVVGGDWYAARQRALELALEDGVGTALILCGHVQLFHQPHGGAVHRATEFDTHGLWLYLERLARRFNHVYVPPLAWRGRRFVVENNPTLPVVAAYRVSALPGLDLGGVIGYQLVSRGHDSFTVFDYFQFDFNQRTLDEHGSATTWSKKHGTFLNSFL